MIRCAVLVWGLLLQEGVAGPAEPEMKLVAGGSPVYSLAFLPDGRRLLSSGGGAVVWDLASKKEISRLEGVGADDSYEFQLTSLGNAIVGYQYAGEEIGLWDPNTGAGTISIFPGGRVTGIGVSPDATWVVSLSNGLVRHDLKDFSKPPLRLEEIDQEDVSRFASSHDGSLLASTGGQGTLRLWHPTKGTLIRTIQEFDLAPGFLAFSPDGARLAVWNEQDGCVSIWSVARGVRLGRLSAADSTLRRLAFSSDGRILAALSSSGKVALWETTSGLRLTDLEAKDESLSLAVSPAGNRIAVGTGTGTILVWSLWARNPEEGEMSAEAFERAWTALADEDPARVLASIRRLAHGGSSGRDRLMKTLMAKPSEESTKAMLGELDDADAAVRTRALEKVEAGLHDPAVRKSIETSPSVEIQARLAEILSAHDRFPLGPKEALRRARAVWALELQGATTALDALTQGSNDAVQTREAKLALRRLQSKHR